MPTSEPLHSVLLTLYEPTPPNSGASHRSTQILYDLKGFGPVHNFSRETERAKRVKPLSEKVTGRLTKWIGIPNPIETVEAWFFANYESFLRSHPEVKLCVIDHFSLGPVLDINRRHSVKTVIAPHNFETLLTRYEGSSLRLPLLHQIEEEINIYRQCDEVWTISDLETQILSHMGLEKISYYPYRCVGEINERAQRVRKARKKSSGKFFLFIGSCHHTPTFESARWLIEDVFDSPALKDVQLVCAGFNTETLPVPSQLKNRIKTLGWVEPAELEKLLGKCRALLLPRRMGFGTLTRIVDSAAANVPMVTSPLDPSLFAGDKNIIRLPNDRNQWMATLVKLQKKKFTDINYTAWEKKLPEIPIAHYAEILELTELAG